MIYKSRCRVCKGPSYFPDLKSGELRISRHIDTDGMLKECIPSDNLDYLEYMYEKKQYEHIQ